MHSTMLSAKFAQMRLMFSRRRSVLMFQIKTPTRYTGTSMSTSSVRTPNKVATRCLLGLCVPENQTLPEASGRQTVRESGQVLFCKGTEGNGSSVRVLGINAVFHDPSAALVVDG